MNAGELTLGVVRRREDQNRTDLTSHLTKACMNYGAPFLPFTMSVHESHQANPAPDPSNLDDSILKWAVHVDTNHFLTDDELRAIQMYRRAADYIAAGKPGKR